MTMISIAPSVPFLRNFTYLVRIGVINLIQGVHSGELLVDESFNHGLDCFIRPRLERFFQRKAIQTPCDDG